MRRILAAVLALAATVPAEAADFLSSETLEVAKVPGPLAADPAAPFWDAAPVVTVPAAPQHTIRLNDREANQALERATLRTVRVRAVTDGKELAVLLEWADPTESRATSDGVDVYGDAAALQFPGASAPGPASPTWEWGTTRRRWSSTSSARAPTARSRGRPSHAGSGPPPAPTWAG